VRLSAPAGGWLILDAATLTGGPPAEPATPAISSITPAGGTAGTRVTITGTNFGFAQGSGSVTFNGTPATVIDWSNTQILVAAPAGVQSGPVQVTTAGGSSNTNIDFTLAPSLLNISPSVGPVGTVVTITGIGFGSSQGAGSVGFNGIAAVPSSWSDTQITVPVPTGATTGSVVVTQNAPAASTPAFTVTSGPQGSLAPVLQVRFDNSPHTVNLSDPVNQDWVIWGSDGTTTNAVRKAGANLISDVTPLPGTSFRSYPGSFPYSWTGGSPTASGSNLSAGIQGAVGTNVNSQALQLTAPADTTVRTLKIFSSYTGYC